jgi:hypothetical protein
MADDKKDPFDSTEAELASLGFSPEEIAALKQQVQTILQEPEFANAVSNGELKIAITIGDLADQLFGGYQEYQWDEGYNTDFDWESMTPEIRAAMEELYFSDNPPTLH